MNFKNYIFLIFINIVLCQLHWYNHSELEWKTIETGQNTHFLYISSKIDHLIHIKAQLTTFAIWN